MHLVGDAYDFTASGPASYDIHTRKAFYIVNPDSTISTLLADVDSHAAKISGKLAVARRALVKRATFNGCNSSQQSLLLSAAKDAQNYAGAASFLCPFSHFLDTSLYNLVRRLHRCATQHRCISFLEYQRQRLFFL
jgi:hypothetical protein